MEASILGVEVLGDYVVGACGKGFRKVRVCPFPREGHAVINEDACMWDTVYPEESM